MDKRQQACLDRITEAVHYLLKGAIPDQIDISDYPDDEIRQLSEKTNELIESYAAARDFIIPLSQGILEVECSKKNLLTSPFKQLQANLRHLTWQTQQIAKGDFSQRVDFMGEFSKAFNSMVAALDRSRRELKDLNANLQREVVSQASALERARLLQQYLPPEVAKKILEEGRPTSLEQQRQRLTVFRVELRGFAELTKDVEPEDMAAMLNGYLSTVVDVAFAHGATVDKFIQDEVLGFFGAPSKRGPEEDAVACARMAIELWQRAIDICKSWQELLDGPPPVPTIALATGFATVGTFGSRNRLEFTAVGGPVIDAKTILRAAGSGDIVCCKKTSALIRSSMACAHLLDVNVPHKSQAMQVFRIDVPTDHAAADLMRRAKSLADTWESQRRLGRAGVVPVSERTGRLEPGAVLAHRYRLLELVGEGGMGTVYQAEDIVRDLKVALKMVRPDLKADESSSKRLYREIKLARLISHPNVAQVYDFHSWEGHEFITMEYIHGETLTSYLKRSSPISIVEGKRILRELCLGISAAHVANIVHRDLKPSNIMLERSGRVVILDFGLARWLSGLQQTQTESHAMLGTPFYMAPEQFEGKKASRQADIYALGVVAFEMFTGQRPFIGENVVSMAYQVTHNTPPDPLTLNPDLPPRLAAVILRCLEKSPGDRFDTVGEIAAFLTDEPAGRNSQPQPS